MKTIILYATKYNGTTKLVTQLSSLINGEVTLLNLKNNMSVDLSSFDNIIIGGSVYAGMIRKEVKSFIERNLETIKAKNYGLFICGMNKEEELKKQLDDVFDSILVNGASATAYLGGRFDFTQLNFLEKIIIKKVSGVKESTEKVYEDQMKVLGEAFN